MLSRSSGYLALFFVFLTIFPASAVTNNLALTPPMGWNDWNAYGCGISQTIVSNNARVMVASGLAAAGYQYVNVDDCWQVSRNSNNVIVANPASFPSGMAWLANYVHSTGLKFGLYTDHGSNTCQGKPGSYQYEYLDAFTYAQWGADYLKEDDCNAGGLNAEEDYGRMSHGLMLSGRPIFLCLCGNGANTKGYDSWSPVLGNQWRTTGDIGDNYASMVSHLDPNSTTAFAAGPGRWNDPDMLEIGNGGMNLNQEQVHFAMWCEMAAPLIMGNNLANLSAAEFAILTNAEVIAVDQDPAGEQGIKVVNNVTSTTTNEVWSKTLGYDFSTKAVALLNRWGPAASITVNWTNIGLQAGPATVRDLLGHSDLGTYVNGFTEVVPSNSVALLKIVGTPPALPVLGTDYLTSLQPVYQYTGWGTIVDNQSIAGDPITLGGVVYTNGIGVNSFSGLDYDLGGICSQFHATIGVDADVGTKGSVIFQVFADGTLIYDSGVMTGGQAPQTINLDVTGVRRLILGVGDADDNINYDHGDWANAYVVVTNTTPQPPRAPTGLIASPGNPILLSWANTVCATNYNVKRSLVSGGPYTTIGTSPVNVFTDSNVVSGDTYYYVISAVSSIGESSNSAEVAAASCVVPAAPANVTTTVVNSTNVVVTWNASAGATSYTVSRFTGSTPPVVIAAGLTTTNFTDTTGVAGTTCYYQVSASNACNQSAPANAFIAADIVAPVPVWNGGSLAGSDWTDSANWSGANIAAGDALAFAGSSRLNNTNNTLPDTLYAGLTFNPNASSFVLNGNLINLSGGITNDSPMPQMINLGLSYTNNITLDGASNSLFIIAGLTNALTSTEAAYATVTLEGTGVLADIFSEANYPAGTNLLATSGNADWTLLDNPSSAPMTVPLVFSVNSGTFNFGSASSAPVLTTTTPDNLPSDNQAGTVSGAAGTFNMINGTVTTASRLNTATASSSLGILNIIGGTMNIGVQFQGANGGNAGEVSELNVSGGTLNVGNGSGQIYVASRGTGSMTISGGMVNCGRLDISRNADGNSMSSSGTVYLDGGLLKVSSVTNVSANAQTGGSPAAAFYFNGGTLEAQPGAASIFFQGSVVTPFTPITAIVQAGGAFVNDGGNAISITEPLLHDSTLGSVPDGGLTKSGHGTLTLTAANTYTGNTTVNTGTLALNGSASVAASAAIIIAGGAALDVSGLSAIFALGSSQTLGNSTSTAVINGSLNADAGALALTYAWQTPSLIVTNGTLTLFPDTRITVNNTGGILGAGNYTLIANTATGNAGTVAGTAPSSVTVTGNGIQPDANASLRISDGTLQLVVSGGTPPQAQITKMSLNGATLTLAATNGTAGGQFVLMESTNIALPLNLWIRVLTNNFDENGNANMVTNIINQNNPLEFYLLQMP